MDVNSGRPSEEWALTKTGTKILFWLTKEEKKYLHETARHLRISKSELIRRLIQKDMIAQ